MYNLIGYYQAPTIEKPLFGRAKKVCLLNPQLYKEGVSVPLRNLGVFKVEIPKDKSSEPEYKGVLEERMRAMLLHGIEIAGGIIIPAENIQIAIEQAQ